MNIHRYAYLCEILYKYTARNVFVCETFAYIRKKCEYCIDNRI